VEPSAAADLEACRAIVAHASKSFYLSSLLLPGDVRHGAWALYAFCRVADDAVDTGEGDAPRRRLHELRGRLDDVYRARPRDRAVDRAFCRLVERARLPKALPSALLDGMAEDLGPRVVSDEAELLGYSVRVAGVVGLMMTVMMGVRDRAVLARANDLGVGMQITNICRDVGEDAARARVYLPASWLREAGTSPEEVLAAKAATPTLVAAVRRALGVADEYYRRADLGLAHLPRGCRWAIASARHIYAGIGVDLAAHGYDSITRRAHVSTLKKVKLLAYSLAAVARSRRDPDVAPPVADAAPLIDAIASA
jgi:phytoene synthase